ncbi:MAG: hypothetical protein PHD48_02250 [Alphaproteobacteria bacterium]|nr:hypothetical protein [Alphaproteobacteria bacterium]
MQIVRENEKRTIRPLRAVTIHEYDTHNADLSGATAEIKGRYPERGYVMNKVCKELVFIMEGGGKLIMPSGETMFAKGDILFLDINEKYAWEGDMVLFMATTPLFDPAQHVEVD